MSGGERLEAEIRITGRVQGVGFRPFIFREAVRNGLTGHVINLGDSGVEVIVEGYQSRIESFVRDVKSRAPSVAEMERFSIVYRPYRGRFKEFSIDKSNNGGKIASGIFPPDIGICDDCRDDMDRLGSRWYRYPFTACAWCGPRFTGIRSLPYDRERTHMDRFPMCSHCGVEYHNPMDRRFDAQGITCSSCGPKMRLFAASGKEVKVDDVFENAAELLNQGKILGIKGIGGVHIATIADDDKVVEELRERKMRPRQPFALMSGSLDDVRSFTEVSGEEEEALTSWRKPIVLLKKNESGQISELVAPGLDRIGVMLPYSGIHVMLFKGIKSPALIMTSGNKPGLPMAIENKAAINELNGIVDFLLLHDREIVARCDDSVLRVIDGKNSFIRRSRGFVPDPIELPIKNGQAIAVGAELRNSAAISLNGKCYVTQYLGDITNLESIEYEKDAVNHMTRLLNITRNPDVIGCDLHPGYMTSQLAEEISQVKGAPIIKSQHHHAHIASVCAEHGIPHDEDVIGIALDGAGYGINGDIWGGEVIISNYENFIRVGHMENLPMPGGDLCTFYPLRMLISALTKSISDDEIRDITKNHVKSGLPRGEKELNIILKQARMENVLNTSSSGRFLDSISAMTGLCYKRTYEGEPAMLLESFSTCGNPDNVNLEPEIKQMNGIFELKTSNMLYNLTDILEGHESVDIAAFGQKYLSLGVSEIAELVSEIEGIKIVALSGGVFSNEYIMKFITKYLSEKGLSVITNELVPLGDGGSALGQSVIALANVI